MVYALILIAGSGKRFDEKVSKNLLSDKSFDEAENEM